MALDLRHPGIQMNLYELIGHHFRDGVVKKILDVLAVERVVQTPCGTAEDVGLLNYVGRETLAGEGQCGCHARDAAAYDEGALADGNGYFLERN